MQTKSVSVKNGVAQDSISDDDVFYVLSNKRRRNVIKALMQSEPLSKSEIIDDVTARETGEADSDARGNIQITLHQNHFPKLTDHGIVDEMEFGEETHYQLGNNAHRVIPHIKHCFEESEEEETVVKIEISK